MNVFHERLKEAMKQAKISQCALARLIGVKQPTIWEWLNVNYPSLERFYQICSVLNTSPSYLLGLEN